MSRLNTLLVFVLIVFIPLKIKAQLKFYSLQCPQIILDGGQKIAILNFRDEGNTDWYYSLPNDYGSYLSQYMIEQLQRKDCGVYTKSEAKQDIVEMKFVRENSTGSSESQMSQHINENNYVDKLVKQIANTNNYMDRYRTDVYDIMEKRVLDSVINIQALDKRKLIEKDEAVNIGKLLDADIIIIGSYSVRVKFKVKRTGQNPNTSEFNRDDPFRAKKSAIVNVEMRMVSVETGEILQTITETFEKEKNISGRMYSEAESLMPTDDLMLKYSLRKISFKLISHFSPVFKYRKLELQKPTNNSQKRIFEDINKRIEDNKIFEGYLLVKEINRKYPNDPSMVYNMGVFNEAFGNFDLAFDYYSSAWETSSYKNYTTDTARVVNSNSVLKEFRMNAVTYSLDDKTKDIAIEENVTITGKKKDRYEVRSEATEKSSIIAKVPGGTEFVKLGEEGNWVKIKLIGGKEGFIDKKYLKK